MTRRTAWLAGCVLLGATSAYAASPSTLVHADSIWLTLQQLTGAVATPLDDSLLVISTRFSPTLGSKWNPSEQSFTCWLLAPYALT